MKRLVILIALLSMLSASYGQEAFDIDNRLDTSDSRRLAAAMDLADKVKQAANYVKNLNELRKKHQLPLPVGIQSTAGYLLVVSNIERENGEITKMHLSCVIPLKNRKIGFDGEFTINGNSGICSPGKIEIIEPVTVGKNFKMTFKRGTFAEFDCEGIQKFHAETDIQIDSTGLVFYDSNNKISNQIPRFSTTLDFEEIDNFTFSLDKKVKFGFRKLKDWIFSLERLDFDNSEITTSAAVKFPEGYFSNTDDKNLWRGVSIGKSQLQLPKKFGKDTTKAITINCDYFIADDNGFTVFANAQNLGHELDKTKNFDIAVDNLEFNLMKNKVQKVAFDGDFNWKALGRFSQHYYDALYDEAANEFYITTNLGDSLNLDFICAELQLDKTTKLDLRLRDGNFVPKIIANGNVTINAGDEKSAFHVPQLDFENLQLSVEKPYFSPGIWQSEGSLSAKFGGFELQINDISMKNDSLKFGVDMAFNEKMTAGGKFYILGDYDKLKLKKFGVSKFYVDYKSNSFSVYGNVEFDKNDPVYGNYFRGDVIMELVDMMKVESTALFGRTQTYKYFFADLMMDNGGRTLFKIPPYFDVYGIGGGAYNKMGQSDKGSNIGKAPSGLYYKPDFNVGFGFLASMKFGVVNKDICDANTSFEIQFNKHWGVNFVQFKGDAVFLSSISKKFPDTGSEVSKKSKEDKKEEAQTPESEPSVKNQYPFTASSLIKMNFAEKSFLMYLRTYLNLGVLYGKGEGKKLTDATAYFGRDDWYIHLGTPQDRCGIVANAAAFQLDVNSYFMVGKNIPALPDPPQKVTSMFSSEQWSKYQQRRDYFATSTGKGVIFGTGFETSFSVEPWPFFASLSTGIGGDFMLVNYGKSSHCEGSTSPLGIGGWYANAQLWAYLDASIGIQVKFLGKRRKFNIMDAAAAAVLQGAGPNPFYFTGLVGCKYSVLGGLFKGKCSLNFEIGEPCTPVEGGKELLDQSIIASMTPADGSDTVNVFVSPQVLLNIDCKNEMPLEIDGVKNIYKVFVDSLKLVNFATKQEVKGSMDISSDGLIISFNPDEALESTTKFVLMAQVSFRQRVGNDWVVAKDSEGTEYVERMETKFTSGKRPDHILPQHLICSYPLDKMYNFYPKETNTGYICLSENYSYLFDKVPEGYEQKLRFSTLDGKSQTSDFEHFKSKEVTNEKYELSFDLSKFAFDNQNIYKLEIVNIPKRIAVQNENVTTDYTVVNGDSIRQIAAEGDFNQLETKQICELNFRVSKYNTLKEKLAVVKLSGTAVVYGESATLKNMEVNLITDDYFDGFECQTYYNDTSLLRMNANLNQTDWYRKSIYSKMYAAYSKKDIGNDRVHSTPPADALDIFNPDYCNHWNLKDSEIQANFASGLNQTGNYGYYVVFYCHDDIMKLRAKIAEKRDKRLTLNGLETEILNYSTPPQYEKGKYPYTLSYHLPGKGTITSSFTENFIVK